MMNMNNQHLILLILLDLSAAFDTVEHSVLLNRLHLNFGISGHVFSSLNSYLYKRTRICNSYLYKRTQSLSIHGHTSRNSDVKLSVPQGTFLGPSLFVTYVSKLFTIVGRHLPQVDAYADDNQLYIAL